MIVPLQQMTEAQRFEHWHMYELELIRQFLKPTEHENEMVRFGTIKEFFEEKRWKKQDRKKLKEALAYEGYLPVSQLHRGQLVPFYNLEIVGYNEPPVAPH